MALATPAAAAPAGSTPAAAMVGLQQGSRGDAVRVLQQTLQQAGIPVAGGIDGIFGPGTAAAVRHFQSARGLQASGTVDAATASALAGGSAVTSSNPLFGLRIGASGDAVRQLRAILEAHGFSTQGDAEGLFGVNTVNALTSFQYGQRIKVTARVDEATLAALGKPVAVPATGQPAATSGSGGGSVSLVGLTYGSLGDSVKVLQQALIKVGVGVRGGADGVFGSATRASVKAFQTSQGLPATGSVDQATAERLTDPKPAAPPAPESSGGSVGFATYGERGNRVSALQRALVNAGITVRGGIDGTFGSGTAAAVMEFQRARGIRVTGVVDQATAEALGLAPGASPAPVAAPSITLQAFPVQGKCFYGDTFHVSRGGGRLHEGTDIGAAQGKYVYAAGDGRITSQYWVGTNKLTGNGLKITMADGTYFFYAHLLDFAPGIGLGSPVKAGQIIGFVGTTGNSAVPHLHFEVHPRGGAAVNPYPLLKAVNGCGTITPPAQP